MREMLKKVRYQIMVIVAVAFIAGCMLFDETGPDGKVTKKGVVTQLAEGAEVAGAVGVPYAGLVGGALGVIGLVGAWFKNNENKRNLKGTVELIEVIKPKVSTMADSEELKKLIVKVTDGTKFGAALKKAHATLKKI